MATAQFNSPAFASPSINPSIVRDLRDRADSFILGYLRANGLATLADLINAASVLDVYCSQADESGCIESQLNADIAGFVAETAGVLVALGGSGCHE